MVYGPGASVTEVVAEALKEWETYVKAEQVTQNNLDYD